MLPAVYHNADFRYQMGDTRQYLYVFAKPSPHMDGTFATNHCTEMPFVFNDKTVTVHAGDAFFDEMAAYKPARWKYRQAW